MNIEKLERIGTRRLNNENLERILAKKDFKNFIFIFFQNMVI